MAEINIEKMTQNIAQKAIQELRDNGAFVSRWIPVSERLPEVCSEVLVCFDFKGKRSVYISTFYGDGVFCGLDDEYLTLEGRKYRKAVAWMPLPEPYKASPAGAESEDVKTESFHGLTFKDAGKTVGDHLREGKND